MPEGRLVSVLGLPAVTVAVKVTDSPRGRRVRSRGQIRRGRVGVLGASREHEVVDEILTVVLAGAVVVQLDGNAGAVGVAARRDVE